MLKNSLLASLLLLASSMFATGCIIDNNNDCFEVCEPVCEVRCDPWECVEYCWDECYDECTYVDEYVEYEDDVPRDDRNPRQRDECSVDADCSRGDVCDNGSCEDAPAEAGLCQPCERNSDCSEEGARCLQINGSENVCGRACEAISDCPRGFECLEVSQEVNIPKQCVPVAEEEGGARSCNISDEPDVVDPDPDPDPEPACRLNSDCAEDENCEDGVCTPSASLPDCREDRDCAEGQSCTDGECIDPEPEPEPDCLEDVDCAEELVCVEGACVEPEPELEPACVEDAECGEGMICLEGACSEPQCLRSTECPEEGQVCVNARCEAGCDSDEQCDEGESCLAPGFCAVAADACTEDSDCPEGKTCDEGACVSL